MPPRGGLTASHARGAARGHVIPGVPDSDTLGTLRTAGAVGQDGRMGLPKSGRQAGRQALTASHTLIAYSSPCQLPRAHCSRVPWLLPSLVPATCAQLLRPSTVHSSPQSAPLGLAVAGTLYLTCKLLCAVCVPTSCARAGVSRPPPQSAALGLAIAGALALGYSNIFVTAPSPENLRTLFEFVFKVRGAWAGVKGTHVPARLRACTGRPPVGRRGQAAG